MSYVVTAEGSQYGNSHVNDLLLWSSQSTGIVSITLPLVLKKYYFLPIILLRETNLHWLTVMNGDVINLAFGPGHAKDWPDLDRQAGRRGKAKAKPAWQVKKHRPVRSFKNPPEWAISGFIRVSFAVVQMHSYFRQTTRERLYYYTNLTHYRTGICFE